MHNIVFMGTPEFAVPVLEALIETQNVVGVVTQPDRPAGRGQEMRPSPVKAVAQAHNLPLYQPPSLREPQSTGPLRRWQPEAIVVAAFGQILRPHLLQLPPLGCINVHASLLPRWRGASPIQHAILAGDEETGISLMQMDQGLDTGPVYVRRTIPLAPRETAQTLHDRLAELGGAVIHDCLPQILAGELTATPQDDEASTYAPLIKKEDGRLDWMESSTGLDRRIRAMTPWPGAFTSWAGRRLKVLEARPAQAPDYDEFAPAPGTVWQDGEQVLVAAGQGALQLLEVQLAGKRAMPVVDFVNGHPEFLEASLGR